jgi:hypothetical protein
MITIMKRWQSKKRTKSGGGPLFLAPRTGRKKTQLLLVRKMREKQQQKSTMNLKEFLTSGTPNMKRKLKIFIKQRLRSTLKRKLKEWITNFRSIEVIYRANLMTQKLLKNGFIVTTIQKKKAIS